MRLASDVIQVTILDEPRLEFGNGGLHQEQRAGIIAHGPADIGIEGRTAAIKVGLVGDGRALGELREYLESAATGVEGKETDLVELFPEFPGCSSAAGFRAELEFSPATTRAIGRRELQSISVAADDSSKIAAAVGLCASAVEDISELTAVDVVVIARPPGVPDKSADGSAVGDNFHDRLKACLAAAPRPTPVQLIRPVTWKGGAGVEDPATTAWNLFSALFYKAGGKPWRLHNPRSQPTRCFVGVAFAQAGTRDKLFATVAQVFNELGEGVIVRGAAAKRSERDRQPHLTERDAESLLRDALARYRNVHGNLPASVIVHKASSFTGGERAGFLAAADAVPLTCELLWLTNSDNAMVIRGGKRYPPLRGTLVQLDPGQFLLYTHGSVPYYRTYPGMYVPRPIGVRPTTIERPIDEIAGEILSLTKLNWNRARMEARMPITLLTARRVGDILRHVPAEVQAAPLYRMYM
jgi:hypothetical protein